MPTFYFEAVDRTGKKVKKEVDASNVSAVRDIIRSENLVPVRIKQQTSKHWNPFERITAGDLFIFTQELQTLLSSGMPLDRSLFILSEHSGKPAFKKIVKEVYADIQKGQSLSQAMSKHKIFPNLYVNMIKAGEEGGILEPVLTRIAAFLETTTKFKEELLSSLIYPLLLIVVGGLTIAVLMLYVIPKFAVIFEDMGQALPLPTQILIDASNLFISYWWLLAVGAMLTVSSLRAYARTNEGRIFFDDLKLKLPIIKKLHVRLAIARFSRTMGTLIKSGVQILTAIKISKEVIGNIVISRKLSKLQEGVSKGRGVYNPLKEIDIFPKIVSHMIAVGEESGTLEETFLLIADRFENDSRNMIRRLISFMEPALILLMGIMVGFIVLSMLLAIFGIYEVGV